MSLLLTPLVLPRPLPEVFEFFADAGNRQRITPPWVDFPIATPLPIAMRVGAHIAYRLRVRGGPSGWRIEITVWQPPHHFADTQRSGPYWRWVHSHRFREVAGGTMVEDEVDFAAPGGWPIERLFVRRDLTRIFLHRQHATLGAFGVTPDTPPTVQFR